MLSLTVLYFHWQSHFLHNSYSVPFLFLLLCLNLEEKETKMLKKIRLLRRLSLFLFPFFFFVAASSCRTGHFLSALSFSSSLSSPHFPPTSLHFINNTALATLVFLCFPLMLPRFGPASPPSSFLGTAASADLALFFFFFAPKWTQFQPPLSPSTAKTQMVF